MRRLGPVLALVALVALAAARAFAAGDAVAIRAAAHDGFARIAFDWPAPVAYEAAVANDILTIHFARQLQAQPGLLARVLAADVASAALDAEGKTLVVHLKRPMTVHAFTVKATTVVVDLTPSATPKPAPPKPAPPKPAAAVSPEHAEAKPATVRLSASGKSGATRISFAWPRPVRYDFAVKDGTARLTFHAAGDIDQAALAAMLPALAPAVAAGDGATSVTLGVPAGIHVKLLRGRKGVTLAVSGTASPPPAAAPPAPPPAAPQSIVPPVPAVAAAAAPAAAPAATKAPPPASVAVHFTAADTAASLRFDWPVATGAAIFRRGGAVWVVFAAPTALDLAEPLAHGQPAIAAIAQLPAKDATVVRLVPRDGLEPSVHRAGTAWIIDLKTQPAQPDSPILVEARPAATPAALIFHAHQADRPVRLADATLGDLLVVPLGEVGRGVAAPPQLVELEALPSVQGIVLRPLVGDLALHVTDDAVEVTRPGGLALSSERDRLLGHVPERAHALFDFAGWLGPADADYVERRAALERAIADVPPAERSQPRLDLAHFYFAHLFAAETLAVIAAIGRDDPALAEEPPVRALVGASCLLADELKCAADALGQHGLDGDPEATLWRASLAARSGDFETAATLFLDSASLLPTYPKTLRDRFALEAAGAMLETGRITPAAALIDLVLRDQPSPADNAMAVYLDGRRALKEGKLDDALARWDQVAQTNDPLARAHALYDRALALLDAKRASPADTVKALDALRFAWRGDGFEFTLLRRLGELRLAQGDAGGGLEALDEAAMDFPDNAAAKDVAKEASDAFAGLFLGDHGDDLPPVSALALYDQFHDLEPVGERRDQIVRKLIDRLVAVDLLDRASLLLEEQVTKRLAGLDKARGATQLALLRLMDHQPDDALAALDIDVGPDLPADLARQRQQLRARVLMELGKPADALALLSSDQSRDADRLRADIYWRGQDWKQAAATLGRLAGAPPADGKIDAETGRVVVSLAAALTLADDQPALAKLRAQYGQAMGATGFADAFRVLAGDGADSADPRAFAGRVAQIGELQSFMAAYKQKLASGASLSTIN